MTDIYYKLSDGTNDLIFILKSPSVSDTRQIWKLNAPYVKDTLISDQISTDESVTLECSFKPGTGYPYATIKAVEAAIDAIQTSTQSPGITLQGGDWNGSAWVYNSDYPFEFGSGSIKLLLETIRYKSNVGASYDVGEV